MLCLKQTNTGPAPARAAQSSGEPGFSKYHKNVKRSHWSPEARAAAMEMAMHTLGLPGPPPLCFPASPFLLVSPSSMRKPSRCWLTPPFWSPALRYPLRHPNRSICAVPWGLILIVFLKHLGGEIGKAGPHSTKSKGGAWRSELGASNSGAAANKLHGQVALACSQVLFPLPSPQG